MDENIKDTTIEECPDNMPFYIDQRLPKGGLKDWTMYIFDERKVLRIYFRYEGFFINPPDNRMYNRIIRKIEKYGISFVEKKDFNDIRAEFKYAPIEWLKFIDE